MKRAVYFLQRISHRIGVEDEGDIPFGALEDACTALNQHPWQWAADQEVTITTVVGQDWLLLPPNVARVNGASVDGRYLSYEVDGVSLRMGRAVGGCAYSIGSQVVGDQFRDTLELSFEPQTPETLTVYCDLKIPRPVSSTDFLQVPDFLEKPLLEMACAIAMGEVFPDEASTSIRVEEVWRGAIMRGAKQQDGLRHNGPAPQVGAGAIESSQGQVHRGIPRGRWR